MDEPKECIDTEWSKHLMGHHADENYVYGYVTSEASVYTLLEVHKRVTTTTFSVRDSSSLQFNPTAVEKFSTRNIFYSKSSSPRIPDDGVPFLFGGKKILECQFGPVKRRQRTARTALINDKESFRTRTRKKGCEAKISIKQICRFPQYAVSSKKNVLREQKKTKERLLKDLREGKEVEIDNRYYLELPLKKAHRNHNIGGAYEQKLHPTITLWIDQLIREGMSDSLEIQATLRQYVKMRMSDSTAPSETDRAYYPKLKDLRNHIYLAKIRLRKTKLGQDWKTDFDGAHTYFRPYFKPYRNRKRRTTVSVADKTVREGPVAAAVEMETNENGVIQYDTDVTVDSDDDHTEGYCDSNPFNLSDDSNPLNISLDSLAQGAQDPHDSGNIYSGAIPIGKSNSPSEEEEEVNRSRKKAHEALEVLRLMTYQCTNGPALDALTAEIETLTKTFEEFIDGAPEGLPLLPHYSAH